MEAGISDAVATLACSSSNTMVHLDRDAEHNFSAKRTWKSAPVSSISLSIGIDFAVARFASVLSEHPFNLVLEVSCSWQNSHSRDHVPYEEAHIDLD